MDGRGNYPHGDVGFCSTVSAWLIIKCFLNLFYLVTLVFCAGDEVESLLCNPLPSSFLFCPSLLPSRRGHDDLGDHYLDCGDLSNALKCYSRARDYCTSAKHVINMCLNVIKVGMSIDRPTPINKPFNKLMFKKC